MKITCTRCGKEAPLLVPYKGDMICHECLMAEAEKPVVCPVCGAEASPEDCVSMLVCPRGATAQEKARAPEVYVTVCPKCHGMFMEEVHYQTMKLRMKK